LETLPGQFFLEKLPEEQIRHSHLRPKLVYPSPVEDNVWYKARLNLIEKDSNESKEYLSLLISNCTTEVNLTAELSVFENITSQNWNAIVFANVEGIIEYVNPAATRIFGYKEDELIGQSVGLLHPPNSQYEKELIESVLKDGVWFGEVVAQKKDGQNIDILLSLQVIKDENGQPQGIASNSKDLTGEKETANKLKKTIAEKEDLLKELSIFESITSQNWNAIVFANTAGIIEYVNPAVLRVFGYEEKELIGQHVDILDPPGSGQTEALTELTMEKGVWSGEVTAKRKDGQIIDVLLSLQVIKDENGQPLGTASNNKDITNEKETANKLKKTIAEKESLLKDLSIFESITSQNWNAIVFANTQGIVEYINPAAVRIFGYEKNEFIGQSVDILDVPGSELSSKLIKSVLEQGLWTGEVVAKKKNGQIIDILLSLQIIKDENGQPLGFSANCKDISGEKETANKLKKIIGERETLLKEIHHRVKNNLQVITSLLSLQSNTIDDEMTKSLFQQSQYRINAMAMIHETLYQFEEFLTIGYADYMQVLCHYLIMSMKGHDTNVKLTIDAADVKLNIDTAIPLGLLINEIITNALKYGIPGDDKGEIYIDLKEEDYPNFVLKIGDNGVGFSDEINFRKTNSLGLKLIHNLTRQLGGEIRKETENKGTHYIINFQEIE